jgi:superfamily I DNA and/or RNA helicase
VILLDARVVAGTCVGFSSVRGMQNIEYDVCILDEASKATVTEALVPLARAKSWILVGDRNQLPPFVEAELEDARVLAEHDISRADLTETLLAHLADSLPGENTAKLLRQHRMVRPIGDLISECFYDGELQSVGDLTSFPIGLAIPRPVTWLSTARLRNRAEIPARPSYKNLAEIEQVKLLLLRLEFAARSIKRKYSVALLTGYSAQREEMERTAAAIQGQVEYLDLECNTVDAFQGREADIAVYSVTRSNSAGKVGFLSERSRLNVGLSRGRLALVIVGDHVFCRSVQGRNPFQAVLDYVDVHPETCAMVELGS